MKICSDILETLNKFTAKASEIDIGVELGSEDDHRKGHVTSGSRGYWQKSIIKAIPVIGHGGL
jgi:hypothetical protein